MKKITHDRKLRKIRRVRGEIFGTGDIPRVSVYRSNRYIYVQAIDDEKRRTITSSSSFNLSNKKSETKVKKTDEGGLVGKHLAQQLVKKGITKGVFDRGRYAYLGRVKSLVEGLREGGLKI